MKRIILILLFTLPLFASSIAQEKKYTKQTYIDQFKGIAQQQMQSSGIPASIILAQACLESGYGNSSLTTKGRNHFGIKCHRSWQGKKMYHDDDAKGECFRVYENDEESFTDHSDFLRYNKRYASLFDLDPKDYKAWAHGLKKAGYATNPKYAELLIATIESNKLHQYDAGITVAIPSPNKIEAIDLDNFVIELNRRIYTRNNVQYIIAGENDSYQSIAEEFKLRTRQLLRFNDLKAMPELVAGTELYIKSKRSRAAQLNPVHIAQTGETMQQIAQKYGVKLRNLYHYNNMKAGEEPEEGQEIFMRNKMRR